MEMRTDRRRDPVGAPAALIRQDAVMTEEHTIGVEWVEPDELTRSTRTPEELRVSLETWLRGRTGDPAAAITDLDRPSANGMSSETVLFDANWMDGAARDLGSLRGPAASGGGRVPDLS